ncbi:MAG: hypothetical protein Q7J86_15305 [Bacteroidota bacterium]|nr:hypothetical protein [Bacteroidota bacterium]MDO9615876.1 hypothetical protein [Bacteroidota bacterium]
MGLSFHYSGRIAKPASLSDLIEEIEDIAKVHNWKYFVFDRLFPENMIGKPYYNQRIYGICFTPPNCETVDICFLSNGRMSSAANLQFWGKTDEQAEREYLYMLSVKTQYAGIEIHQFLIQLFMYLNAKYFADFTMTDEGEYWETNDLSLLKTNFKRYTELIDGFVSAIESIPIKAGEDVESYFLRLMKEINDKKNREE